MHIVGHKGKVTARIHICVDDVAHRIIAHGDEEHADEIQKQQKHSRQNELGRIFRKNSADVGEKSFYALKFRGVNLSAEHLVQIIPYFARQIETV